MPASVLAPQKDWEINLAEKLSRVLKVLEQIQGKFNGTATGGKKILSLADLIVLAGGAAVEKAAKDAGIEVTVPFYTGSDGRTAGADRRPVIRGARAKGRRLPVPTATETRNRLRSPLLDKASSMRLTAPGATVLIGGLRVLNATSTAQVRRLHQPSRS